MGYWYRSNRHARDAQEMCAHVETAFVKLAGKQQQKWCGSRAGSVKPVNIAELMSQDDIDGALVGGAALEAESFARIAQYRLQ